MYLIKHNDRSRSPVTVLVIVITRLQIWTYLRPALPRILHFFEETIELRFKLTWKNKKDIVQWNMVMQIMPQIPTIDPLHPKTVLVLTNVPQYSKHKTKIRCIFIQESRV